MQKKTVFIISQSLNGGGAERVASNLSQELIKNKDYQVYLVLFDGQMQTYPSGAEIIDLHLGPQKSKIGKATVLFKRVWALRRLKKQYHTDISISLLSSPNVINVLSRQQDSVVISVRNLISKSAGSILEKALVRFASRFADMTVSLSELVRLDLIEHFGIKSEKVITIYNSCDPARLLTLSEQEDFKMPDYPYMVTMGRLTHQKGQWHLIRAFKLIHERFPDLKLVILGEGELKVDLQRLINQEELSDVVYLYGYIKSPHKIIQGAEAFLFTSLFEGLGNVILEAMACGVPVISADCPAGPREIMSAEKKSNSLKKKITEVEFSDYGILTPPFPVEESPNFEANILTEQEQKFAEAVISLYKDKKLYTHYKAQSLKRIQSFSADVTMGKWKKLLEQL